MKTCTFLFAVLFTAGFSGSFAQNTWTQKADFAGTAREAAVGFSIGNKGYIGTGSATDGRKKDFWEYDPSTDAWTQKANVGGQIRAGATGFSIGSKGYIGTGTGSSGTYKIDFWEYNPISNSWIQKVDFAVLRAYEVGFSIGSKGYIGTGAYFGSPQKDFWEYDPSTDVWTQKADFGGPARYAAAGFSIGSKGYIGTGTVYGPAFNDFWEYNPSTNAWTQKANVGGGTRCNAVGFSIGSKGYIGTGLDDDSHYHFKNDFWEYDPGTDMWIQKADVGGLRRDNAVGFSIGSNGYVGTGYDFITTGLLNDFWQYTPSVCNGLYVYADADSDGYGNATDSLFAANCIAPAGYATNNTDCNDANSSIHPSAMELINGIDDNCNGIIDDVAQNAWIKATDVGGTGRFLATGFSIKGKGYIGTGYDYYNNYKKDFWEYDTITNAWTQKADFGGTARVQAVGFSIGNKGYIGTGHMYSENTDHVYKDFWEYDPATNAWTQKTDFGGIARVLAVGFSIGSKGYIGTGYVGGSEQDKGDFWEYDPATDTWTQKADFAGTARYGAVGFSIGSKGYIGTGGLAIPPYQANDFWEYNPATNTWIQKADFGGASRYLAIGFSIGSKGYIGTGTANQNLEGFHDFWEYDPDVNGWIQKASFAGPARTYAVGVSIGNKGYIGTGSTIDYPYYENDFWKYYPGCASLMVYADADGDGYGNTANALLASDCALISGYVLDSTDCDDANAAINPAAMEVINGIDDNCDGIIDNACPLPANLSVSNITDTSAKLKWSAVTGAIGYKVRYKVANTNDWKNGMTYNISKPIIGLLPNTAYKWEVRTVCQMIPSIMSEWSPKQDFATAPFRLGEETLQQVSFQLYPNPAEDQATIQFIISQSSHLSIKVYDASGKEIETILNHNEYKGNHSFQFNIKDFSEGIYFVKMISDFGSGTQKLMVQ